MKKLIYMLILFLMVIGITGCKSSAVREGSSTADSSKEKFVETEKKIDSNVILRIDTDRKKIKLFNIKTSDEKEFNYSGSTDIRDEYEDVLSAYSLEVGEIVDAEYSSSDNMLKKLYLSKSTWNCDFSGDLDRDTKIKSIELYGQKYKYDDKLLIFSEGRRINFEDISAKDSLKILGIAKQINVIVVTKGHGYVKLENDDNFIGGWIEVGKEISPISKNMLLLVPEGNYKLSIANKGYGGTTDVVVTRNQETVIDASLLNQRLNEHGIVTFKVKPENAEVKVNGTSVIKGEGIDMDYGSYNITASADGYDTYSATLFVNSVNSTIELNLEAVTDTDSSKNTDSTDKKSANTTESGTNTTDSGTNKAESTANTDTTVYPTKNNATSPSNKVYIEAPQNVEVYFDGAYKGKVPVNFSKTSGKHIITLRKSGYVNKSYTVDIGSDDKDVTYAFSNLEVEADE